ncbi:MAG TPA: AI-2E family transporter, partial [Chloroflexota bacterium]|nr:AI-2E family transporter [Chloroflexota bacterium]
SAAWEQQLIALANQLGIPAELVTGVVNQIQSGLDWLVQVVQVLLGVFGGFLSVVFTVIIAIYLASDADHILESIVGLLPRDNRVKIDATLRFTGQRLGRWVIAQVIVASIVSAIWAVGLYFLGIPYIGFLTLIAFMAEFVPLVGPFISSIPTIFVAFATTTPAQGVATALFCLVVEQLENDLIVPRAMSSATTVHPLVVLLAILAGGQLFGPFGALLAVPFATCISVFLSAYRQQEISPELEGVDVGNNL